MDVKKGNQKWMYLCSIKDLFNGEIVAYSIGTSQEIALVHRALNELQKKGFAKGAILHSDQGFQFTNPAYMKRLKDMGINPIYVPQRQLLGQRLHRELFRSS